MRHALCRESIAALAPANEPMHFLDCIDRAATRPISISAVLKIRLEDRLQYDLCGGLDDPVPDCWHAPGKLHFSPTALWDQLKLPIRFILCAASDLSF